MSVAIGTVCGHLKRARAAGLTWASVQGLTDSEVEASLYRDGGRNKVARRAPVDYAHVHDELHKSTATMQLLWAEYQQTVAARGDGLKPYQYSQFCALYGTWRGRPPAVDATSARERKRSWIDEAEREELVDGLASTFFGQDQSKSVIGLNAATRELRRRRSRLRFWRSRSSMASASDSHGLSEISSQHARSPKRPSDLRRALI
ncbi:MAG TPA: hypothetical protein VH062_03395 [Polyangiaceae bacterium]|nr:hypothetical protein [Polyangiaceae bacterium]